MRTSTQTTRRRNRMRSVIATAVAAASLVLVSSVPATAGEVWYLQGYVNQNQSTTSVQVTLNGGTAFANGIQIENHIITLKGMTTYAAGDNIAASARITHPTVTQAAGGRSSCYFALPWGGLVNTYMQCRYLTP